MPVPINNLDKYLTHYWPFTNGQAVDAIGTAHMTQGSLTSFTSDRFGCPNSALALNGGWTQVPSGIYFNTLEFSISVWVYPQQIGYHARVIDFGNGQSDNVLLKLDSNLDCMPSFKICNGSSTCTQIVSSHLLIQNEWQMLTATFNSTTMSIYTNKTLLKSLDFSLSMSQTLIRVNNYIGRSNWPADNYSWSFLDDLRFYNKCLSQSEIVYLVDNNDTSEK